MSLLSIGASCASCHAVDFLPTVCPSCRQTFCSSHITAHEPCSTPGVGYKETNAVAGPSSFRARGICEVGGCGRMSIEGIGGLGETPLERGGVGAGNKRKADPVEEERIAREIRCPGCGGAYCTEHRAQTSHDCTAPLAHNARHDAYVSRKAQAQAVLAKTFPDQAGRVIQKPLPPRDVQRDSTKVPTKPVVDAPLASHASATTLTPIPASTSTTSATATPRPKTKEDKLWDIHVRKIKSLAPPLRGSPGGSSNEEKRYFEWGVGDEAGVKSWEGGAKWAGKLERNSVLASMPLGKLLDLTMSAAKVPTTKASVDPSDIWRLVLLDSSPDVAKPRQAIPLRTDVPVGPQIPDATTIVLCRGWSRIDGNNGGGEGL